MSGIITILMLSGRPRMAKSAGVICCERKKTIPHAVTPVLRLLGSTLQGTLLELG
jgi:hypothetical protein